MYERQRYRAIREQITELLDKAANDTSPGGILQHNGRTDKKQAMDQTKKIHALFDTPRFWRDLDALREERGTTWSFICRVTGVTTPLGSSGRPDNPHIDTLVQLAAWGGLSLDAYISGDHGQSYCFTYDVARFYADLDFDDERRERIGLKGSPTDHVRVH